jgi:hypothetical protein
MGHYDDLYDAENEKIEKTRLEFSRINAKKINKLTKKLANLCYESKDGKLAGAIETFEAQVLLFKHRKGLLKDIT